MLQFVGAPQLVGSFYNANDATRQHSLGFRAFDEDGGEWVYVKNSSTALARGTVVMQAAAVNKDLWSSDSTLKILTKAAAAMTEGAYSGYYAYVNEGTGQGQLRRIASNTVTTITLDEALTSALAVGDSDLLIFHPYVVDVATVNAQSPVVGVAQNTITANYYGWVKCAGVAEVLAGNALTRGLYVKLGDDTAGQVKVAANTNDLYDATVIGIALQATTSADVGTPVMLNIK